MNKPKLSVPTPDYDSGTFPTAKGQIFIVPSEMLEEPCAAVEPRDGPIVRVAERLVATMRSHGCVGLSAPQIGEPVRLVAMDVNGLVILANPRILQRAGQVVLREECPSVPNVVGLVSRAAEVTVIGSLPGSGRTICIHAVGYEARVLQHEIDHLDGLVITDRMLQHA